MRGTSASRLLLAAALLGSLLFGGGVPAFADGAPHINEGPYHLRIGTGPEAGLYHAYGVALAKNLDSSYQGARPLVDLEVLETEASVDNLERLRAGRVGAAIVQSDVAFDAARTEPDLPVRAVAALFPEHLHVVVRRDLGIRTVGQLRGRRIAVGGVKSGTRYTAVQVLRAHGLGPETCTLLDVRGDRLAKALERGEIDAAMFVGPVPLAPVAKLLEKPGLTLLPLDPERLRTLPSEGAALAVDAIAAGSYPGQKAAVPTASVRALLLVAPDVPDLVVAELIVNVAREAARKRLQLVHRAFGRYGLHELARQLPLPLHPGALSYYRESQVYRLPVRVYTSLYLLAVSNLDIKNGSYTMDFYLWFRWKGRLGEKDDELAFEVINGQIERAELQAVERYGGWTYLAYRVVANMRGNFPLHRYPFDHQVLAIQIEPPDYGSTELEFVPDDHHLDGSPRDLRKEALHPGLTISDWRIEDVRQRAYPFLYPTDFGSPYEATQGRTPYSRYVFELELGRVLVPYVVKSILPLTIIVAMSFVVFFIDPREFEVQAGIVITALLSCVAFHISQADALPEVGYLVTADKFFLVSYLVIFFALVEVVLENHFFHSRGREAAQRIDRWARVLFPLGFVVPVAYIFFSQA
ncbi:MAG: TAXI family TRAP transporter solute-binding subunit [Planctomycetota bacterium]|nr:MAG: TAXI family TRAP transporter solute-binding subunit [Planctomycetota bacterium]